MLDAWGILGACRSRLLAYLTLVFSFTPFLFTVFSGTREPHCAHDQRAGAGRTVLRTPPPSSLTPSLYICQVPGNPAARTTSGRELAELCFAKYGRYHDCTILRNKVGGDRWQVAFNIYGPCLGQRSFGYTEQQYLEKLDRTALMLNSWDHASFKSVCFSPHQSLLCVRH